MVCWQLLVGTRQADKPNEWRVTFSLPTLFLQPVCTEIFNFHYPDADKSLDLLSDVQVDYQFLSHKMFLHQVSSYLTSSEHRQLFSFGFSSWSYGQAVVWRTATTAGQGTEMSLSQSCDKVVNSSWTLNQVHWLRDFSQKVTVGTPYDWCLSQLWRISQTSSCISQWGCTDYHHRTIQFSDQQ